MPTVAACAPAGAPLDQLVDVLRAIGKFEIVAAANAGELPATDALSAAVLFLGRRRDLAFESHLQAMGDRVPLLVIGGDVASSGCSAWLPTLPPAPLLGALLERLVEAGPGAKWRADAFEEEEFPSFGPKSWRRKTDILLGESRATMTLLHELDRLAPSAAIVLVTGESGTGKELVARALHYCGPRANEPFIALNCAAIPEPLVEAELFGYQRGAFTGAVAARPGAFEAAQKGTLFLDEIGEMPKAIQPKLLRVLETNEVTRLGSTEARPVLARVVVATNRDLLNEVKEGRFREDLYYRLNVYPVRLEPLRQRPEDIPPIVSHHLGLIAARENRPVPRLTPAALERLLAYAWPGNVRELVNVLGRAVLVAPKNVIDAEHVDLPGSGERAAMAKYRDAKQRFEQEYYTRLIQVAHGNVALAARIADKTRKEVYDALKRVGVDALAYRQGTEEGD